MSKEIESDTGKKLVTKWIDQNKSKLIKASENIWEYAELGLQEYKSSRELMELLQEEGFSIEEGVAGMPTAFVATWGEGKPVIGILGEYDALPGLSQKVTGEKDPITTNGNGHGCGHNIFGVAGVGGAIAAKQAMESQNIEGTIKFYGCPAEETLVGKVYMARDGVFDGMDVCLTWHPSAYNTLWSGSSLATNSVKFSFEGKSSHASTNPDSGRSALKAVQLMDIGVQFLREHIIDEARIHSVITDGGQEPNVIPGTAQIWYYIRAPERKDVDDIYERIVNIAKGAGLMTDTEWKPELITGCYNMLPNKALGNVLFNHMNELGPPTFDQNDKEFASELVESFGGSDKKKTVVKASGAPLDLINTDLNESVVEPFDEGDILAGSTDVSDVSWKVPTAQFNIACVPIGTPYHSWQFVASVGSGIGQKGMITASKVLGLSAIELLKNHNIIEKAKAEFSAELNERGEYESPLPKGAQPPIHEFA